MFAMACLCLVAFLGVICDTRSFKLGTHIMNAKERETIDKYLGLDTKLKK